MSARDESTRRRVLIGAGLALVAAGVLAWRWLGSGAAEADADRRAREHTEALLREAQTIPPPEQAQPEAMPDEPPSPPRNPVPR